MFELSVLVPWLVFTLVLVGIAVGVVYMLAVSRRTPQDWQQHVKEQREAFSETSLTPTDDEVTPENVSLHGMLNACTETGNAYYNPTHLPGFERLEDATERIEQRIAEQRSKENKEK